MGSQLKEMKPKVSEFQVIERLRVLFTSCFPSRLAPDFHKYNFLERLCALFTFHFATRMAPEFKKIKGFR